MENNKEVEEGINGFIEPIVTGDTTPDTGTTGIGLTNNTSNLLDEAAGTGYALSQRGKNIVTLLKGIPGDSLSFLKDLSRNSTLDIEKALTSIEIPDDIINELIQSKLIFKLEDNNPTENIMENKQTTEELMALLEAKTGKKVVLAEAEKVSTTSVGDLTVGEIIPADSARVMEDYVSATLKELKSKIAELETIKFDVNPAAKASAEDWRAKTENVQFSIKQLERISRFVNNTLVAKKFDKNILDKLVALTPEADTATGPTLDTPMIEPAMDLSTPPMTDLPADPAMDLGTDPLATDPIV